MPILPTGKHCCGCSACFSACPHDSITMVQDFEGFYYPRVDPTTCTECKSCEIACPTLPFLELRQSVKKVSRFPYDTASDKLDSRGIFVRFSQSGASYFDTLDSSPKSTLDSTLVKDSSTQTIRSLMKLDSVESSVNLPPPPLLPSA